MTMFILFAALGPAPEMARPVRVMPYAEMHKESDLVMIGVFASERDDGEPIDAELKGLENDLLGVTTKLRVLTVLKGATKEQEVSIRHHRRRTTPRILINARNFAEFKPGNDYLVFLKKRPDGRYMAVNGQDDPAFSVKRIEPRSWVDDLDKPEAPKSKVPAP